MNFSNMKHETVWLESWFQRAGIKQTLTTSAHDRTVFVISVLVAKPRGGSMLQEDEQHWQLRG